MGIKIQTERITVLKLGGSLITKKDVPLTENKIGLRAVGKAISSALHENKNRRIFLVHGGGSFGHFYSKKYGLSESKKLSEPYAISTISHSMLKLHNTVREALMERGIWVETILPSELLSESQDTLSHSGIRHANDAFASGLLPITFGYVALKNENAQIISGDKICMAVAKSLDVDRVIFAMDVDGIYSKPFPPREG